jgi:hypothetical protein
LFTITAGCWDENGGAWRYSDARKSHQNSDKLARQLFPSLLTPQGDSGMKKLLTVLTAALLLGAAVTTTPTPASAQGRGLAAGLVGGLIGGAIIGGAIASSRPAYAGYAVAPGYEPYGGYAAPYPVGCPGGYWGRRPLVDRWGNVVGYSRPRFFCP